MTRLAAILKDCEARGVRLRADGGKLEVRGPSTPEIREALRCNKTNVIHYLRTGKCHHELEPEECAVCGGHVRRLIETMKEDL